MGTLDDAIARLAQGQHGAFNRVQARHQGMSREQLQRRVAQGRFEQVARDLFRMPGSPRTWRQELALATLATAPQGAVSGRSAAALMNWPGFGAGPVDTLIPYGSSHRRPVGDVRRTRCPPSSQLVVVDGLVATNVARTVFDLAAVLHPKRTERLVDSLIGRNEAVLADLQGMLTILGRRGRKGIGVMREILEARGPGYKAPESVLEALALRLLEEHGLPAPVRQLDVGDEIDWIARVDLAYPEHRVIIEIDGRPWHIAKLDADRDALRRARLAAAGWRGLPIREELLRTQPELFISLVAEALAGSVEL